MNLIVDIGNTHIKLAIFGKDLLLYQERVGQKQLSQALQRVMDIHTSVTHAIVSAAGALSKEHLAVVSRYAKVHVLGHASKVPFKNSYATPQTLGTDRMALVTAAFYGFPNRNSLVIDAGSCITYDLLTDRNEYLGGAISPGMGMRYAAMHRDTDKLPLLAPGQWGDFMGNTTESCMHAGVLNGVEQEILGTVRQYGLRFKDLTVILTGGDGLFLSERLKNGIFADTNFLLKGLNHLLEHNKL
ncbi:type III pantothenate kinase [Maribacter sp. 2307ULW6-5]|uniref:type III pantothenate kinase n=1 Tax=Maribacter sp. 2307ULW6-5 TaxID=3386275 RepID=UPI0039BCF7F6